MKEINFFVYGFPVAQQRHRHTSKGGKTWNYDPAESKSWKETVKWSAIEAGATIMTGAITMSLMFHLPRPKSIPKKVVDHVKKPDLSNLIKSVEDSLKGICYRDDSQIISLHVTKLYGKDIFGVDVRITER